MKLNASAFAKAHGDRADDERTGQGSERPEVVELQRQNEQILAEIAQTGRLSAPLLRFATIPVADLPHDPVVEPVRAAWSRSQNYLARAARRWSRCSHHELRAHLEGLARATVTETAVAATVNEILDGGMDLVRLLVLDRELPRVRDLPEAAAFSAALERELEAFVLAFPPSALEQLDHAAAQRAARDAFLERQIPRLRLIARPVARRTGAELDDLVQAGCEAMITVFERYDPRLGVPFIAYAHKSLRQRMYRAAAETACVVLPYRAFRNRTAIRCLVAEALERGDAADLGALARRFGVRPEALEVVVQGDAPIALDDPERGTASMLADTITPSPEERLMRAERARAVRRALASCTAQERCILARLFGIGHEERTVAETARELGQSTQRINQVRRGAIRRLRRPTVARELVLYL